MIKRITLENGGATGGYSYIWYDSFRELFFSDEAATQEIDAVPVPAMGSFRFGGYFSEEGGAGTKFTLSTGGIKPELYDYMAGEGLLIDVTIHARMRRVSWRIDIYKGPGTGGTSSLYYRIDGGGIYEDDLCTTEAISISRPSLTGYKFGGCFTGPDGDGEKYISNAGNVMDVFKAATFDADSEIYVRWTLVSYQISLAKQGGSGGTDALYYRIDGGGIYYDDQCTREATAVDLPSMECYSSHGYTTEPGGGGEKFVTSSGNFSEQFRQAVFTGPATLYATWLHVSHIINIETAGGVGGTRKIYYRIHGGGIYSDDKCTTGTTSIVPPQRIECFNLDGFFGIDDTKYIKTNGNFKVELTTIVLTEDLTIYARWTRLTYPIVLIKNGGTGGTDRLYRSVNDLNIYEDDTAYTTPATRITNPQRIGYRFVAFLDNLDRVMIGADGTISDALRGNLTDGELFAIWEALPNFGNLTDWFGLETPDGPLMLVGSTDGATRSVTDTSHSGALAIQTADSSVGAFERGGILMNPTCTYRIRKSGTVQIKLGKAYGSATIAPNPYRATKSGYMLLQAEYATTSDGEPVLIVRGTANEGYEWTNGRMVSKLTDAINQWTVNLPVDPDHIAQDPMGAVSGGGEMTECKTLITCDPVVPIEGGMPCASDVVHGKVIVTATTNAYLGEGAPTARSPFIETNGAPNSETDVDFTSYAFKAERSL